MECMGHILALAGAAEPIVAQTDGDAIGQYKWTARRTASAFNARIACWNKLEIMPPSFSNHSRYGILEDVCVL
jgi:hypothetical protein